MLIESVPVGLLATRRFDIAAARNAERISTLQRTVWNLERLIFFLSSIRIPSQLPVRTRPANKIKKVRSISVPIHIPSLKEAKGSNPTSTMAPRTKSMMNGELHLPDDGVRFAASISSPSSYDICKYIYYAHI